jgi:hypothetical protein
VKEIGFYKRPNKTGWLAWITTNAGNYFVALDGSIVGPYNCKE